MSRRFMDMRAEGELAAFLDKNLWSHLVASHPGSSFERVHDRDLQIRGADVVWRSANGCQKYIDEKAQLYYVNRTLPTFAFEIDSFQRSGLVMGWLLADDLVTTNYALVYPNACHSDLSRIRSEDFTSVEVVNIRKQRLREWMESSGLTTEYLLSKSADIRARAGHGMMREASISSDAYFVKSAGTSYSEEPLNLVISKSRLYSLAYWVAEVSQGNCRIAKGMGSRWSPFSP